MLSKPETKRQLDEMLKAGHLKSEVFKHFSGGAIKDSKLAYFIASHPDPAAYARNRGKVIALIVVMVIEALVAVPTALALSASMGPAGTLLMFALLTGIPLLLAVGFFFNKCAAYNTYLVLGIMNAQHLFNGFSHTPIASSIAAVISLATLMGVWYVRWLLFPDFLGFLNVRKIKGAYQFKEKTPAQPEQPTPFIDFTAPPGSVDENPFSPPKAQVLKQPAGD